MKATEFCYWLQGLFELSDLSSLNSEQVQKIKNHLKLVFLYDIDPSYTEDPDLQKIFQNIHDGKKPFDNVPIKSQIKRESKLDNGFNSSSSRIIKC